MKKCRYCNKIVCKCEDKEFHKILEKSIKKCNYCNKIKCKCGEKK